MTDRTHIAALALQGLLAGRPEDARPGTDMYAVAYLAVAYADALLAELARTTPPRDTRKGELTK